MNRNLLKLIVACGAVCFIACTAPQKAETEKWSERMACSEMKRFPEPWMIEKAKVPRWGYTHGLVVKSMLELVRVKESLKRNMFLKEFPFIEQKKL